MALTPRLYTDLADWWPLFSRPDDYGDEARLYAGLFIEAASGDVRTVLELGSGGGNTASHLTDRFQMTLVDASTGMLEVSRRLNPSCEHVEGDMRNVRLDRTFDVVFVHDAVMYMTTEDDLRAVMDTAFVHLRAGGAAVFVPDDTRETFRPRTTHGGHDGEGRGVRYLEWTHDTPADATSGLVSFVILTRTGDGPVEVHYDEHTFGLFPRETWLALMEQAGFEAHAIVHTYGTDDADYRRELFVGTKPL